MTDGLEDWLSRSCSCGDARSLYKYDEAMYLTFTQTKTALWETVVRQFGGFSGWRPLALRKEEGEIGEDTCLNRPQRITSYILQSNIRFT
jgi:hypothetical protein